MAEYTVDFCTGGTASASLETANVSGNCFDDNVATFWNCYPAAYPEWLKYDLGVGVTKIAAQYTMKFHAWGYPTAWKFQGSNNNSTWDDLNTQTGQSFSALEKKTYNSFTNLVAYRFYRWLISAGSSADVAMSEFEIMAVAAPPVEADEVEIASVVDSFVADLMVASISQSATIADSLVAEHMVASTTEAANISDSVDGLNLSIAVSETAVVSTIVTAFQDTATVPESIGSLDVMTPNKEVTKTTDQAATIADIIVGTKLYENAIADSMAVADDSSSGWHMAVLDGLFAYETIINGWVMTVPDTFAAVDAAFKILGIPVPDYLSMVDSQVNTWKGQEIVAVEIALYDTPEGVKMVLRSIADGMDMADLPRVQLCLVVPDHLFFAADLIANWKGGETVATTFTVYDTVDGKKWIVKLIDESMAMADTTQYDLAIRILESLGFTDLVTEYPTFNKVLSETIAFSETIGVLSHLYTVVQDGIQLNVTIELDGEVYECWVLNTPKFQASIYSGFNFNSYCSFDGKAYGANSTGIYELTGETDAGAAIEAGAVFSSSTLGIPTGKRLRKGHLGYTGGDPVVILEVEDGTRQVFSVTAHNTIVGNRDVKGREWKLSVTGFDELNFIHLIPIVLTR